METVKVSESIHGPVFRKKNANHANLAFLRTLSLRPPYTTRSELIMHKETRAIRRQIGPKIMGISGPLNLTTN